MRVRSLVLTVCILLGTVLHLSVGDDYESCPPNEVEVECIDFCNTCELDGRQCIFNCIPGCDCIPGYRRDSDGNCIPRRFCDNEAVDDICLLPKDPGPCFARIPRYFFNHRTGHCELFYYGGCLGNENNFKTKEECQKKCPKKGDTPHGCPNVTICRRSCILRGFKSGSCVGQGNLKCKCNNKEPTVITAIRDQGCPDNCTCRDSCKKRGYETGGCQGRQKTICVCVGGRGAEEGTCPDVEKCIKFCKEQGLKSGLCGGPENLHCLCTEKDRKVEDKIINAKWNCNDSSCLRYCNRKGYKDGFCDSARNSCTCRSW